MAIADSMKNRVPSMIEFAACVIIIKTFSLFESQCIK